MKGRYFKKFVGMNSIFSVQTNAILSLNNLVDQPLISDEKVFYREGYIVAYMFQTDIDRIRNFVFEKLNSDSEYLINIYKNTLEKFEDFNLHHDKMLAEISNIDNTEKLKKWINIFLLNSINMGRFAYLAELFVGYDDFWPGYVGLSKEDFNLLTAPEELSYSMEYDFALSSIKLGRSNIKISELASKYYWIRGNYSAVKPLTESDIINDLEKITVIEAEVHYQETLNYIPNILAKKKKILEKINNYEHKSILSAISFFIVLQDKRKATILKTSYIFLKAVNKLLDLYALSDKEKEIIISAAYPPWFTEMSKEKLLKTSQLAYKCFYLSFIGKVSVGDEAIKYYIEEENKESNSNEENVIKGRTGYPGVIKGVVRRIFSNEDYIKFKDGEILVTFMTRPEFVPLIKKSIAVITDEGGITCHAAIVCRELKKPCIIGTMDATKRLKDGDIVEVDANMGVVKIIK